jgi:hypothetical protein
LRPASAQALIASKYVAGVPFHRGAAEIIPIEPARIMPAKGAL